MRKFNACLFLFAFCCLSIARAATPLENYNRLYEFQNKRAFKESLESIPEKERRELIDFLKNAAKHPEVRAPIESERNSMLLNLGEDEAINRAAQKFSGDTLDYSLFSSVSPKIVIATAPFLFKEENYRVISGGDYQIFQVSYATMFGIQKHLSYSPYYTPEVNLWARRIEVPNQGSAVNGMAFERNIMRRWWTANKAAFLRGDYLAVKPGENYPESATPTPTRTPVETPVPSIASSTPRPEPKPTPIISQAPVASSFPMFPVIALLAASMLAIVVYLFSKRRK